VSKLSNPTFRKCLGKSKTAYIRVH